MIYEKKINGIVVEIPQAFVSQKKKKKMNDVFV